MKSTKKLVKLFMFLTAICLCFTFTACDFAGNSVLDIATENGLVSSLKQPTSSTQNPQNITNVTEHNTNVTKEVNEISLYDTYLELKEHENYTGTFSDFLKEYLNDDTTSVDNNIEYATHKGLTSTVSIYVTFAKYYNPLLTYMGTGAGVFYSIDKTTGDAYIVTNFHVVYDKEHIASDGISTNIVCYTYGSSYGISTPINCEYVGGSMQYDLAVLKVSASEQLKNDDSCATTIFDSNDITVGETIIAVGNPEGNGLSATTGVVCVDSEHISMPMPDNSAVVNHRVMRIDAAINAGNSGGGVYNTAGELVGIANAKIVDDMVDNIAYAIPSNVVKYVAEAIIDQCNGTTIRTIKKAIVGITIQVIESSSYYNGQKAEIVETIKIVEITTGALADEKLTLNAIMNKIVITDNSNPESPISTEYEIKRLFHIDAMLQVKAGDTVTFYTSAENGTPLLPVTITITNDCFTAIP